MSLNAMGGGVIGYFWPPLSVPAEENAVEMTTDYLCDCGCRRPILREQRTSKLERPPVDLLQADGGYDSYEAFSYCKKRGVRTTIRVRIDSNCESDDKYEDKGEARSEAVLDQLGGWCTTEQFAKMEKDERKKHQKEWKAKVKFNNRWIIRTILVQEDVGRGSPGRESKIHHDGMATKIAVYNKTRNVMWRRCGDVKTVRQRPRHAGQMSIRASKSR